MHTVILYQMKTSGRWRWKFCYQNRVLARSDYHYASSSKALTAFKNLAKVLSEKTFSSMIEI